MQMFVTDFFLLLSVFASNDCEIEYKQPPLGPFRLRPASPITPGQKPQEGSTYTASPQFQFLFFRCSIFLTS